MHINTAKCSLTERRPGIIEAFITPARMRSGAKKTTNIQFTPRGKTMSGAVQWVAKVMRPGLAVPSIVAKGAPAAIRADVKPEEVAAELAAQANVSGAKAAGFGGGNYYYM